MKVRASVKKICDKCKVIHRHGVVRVIYPIPKHKQRWDRRVMHVLRRRSAKKRAEVGLTYIYGIGRSRSRSLLHRAGIGVTRKSAT